MCPVFHFISLALLDDAFEDCSTIKAINVRRLPPGVRAYRYCIKESVKELPIYRAHQSDGTILPNKILTYGCLQNFLLGLE